MAETVPPVRRHLNEALRELLDPDQGLQSQLLHFHETKVGRAYRANPRPPPWFRGSLQSHLNQRRAWPAQSDGFSMDRHGDLQKQIEARRCLASISL
jgi:hypothetical protein